MKLNLARVVGTASPQGWSQVYSYLPIDTEKLQKRGQLLAVVSLSALTENIEIAVAGREIISRLHEEYYGDLSGSVFERLKQTSARVYEEISQEAQVELGLAVFWEGILYLSTLGDSHALLRRNNRTIKLPNGSGYLCQNDLLLLGTGGFFALVPQGVIEASLSSGLLEQATETLSLAVVGKENEQQAAALIAKYEENHQSTGQF